MTQPRFFVDQLSKKQPVLIIDKEGSIGRRLAEEIQHEFLPVFVSSQKPPRDLLSSIVFVPFYKKPPKIPENKFPFIFFVDSEDRYVRGLMPSLLSYARTHDALLSVITSIYQKKPKFWEKVVGDLRSRIFVVGDVFGGELSLRSVTGSLLLSAKHKRRITLPNHGLDDVYPISIHEVVKKTLKESYSKERDVRLFHFYPQYPLTGLGLSRIIFHIFPHIKLDLEKKKKHLPSPLWFPEDGQAVPLSPLDDQIRDFFEEDPPDEKLIKIIKEKHLDISFSQFFVAGFFIMLLFLLPLFILLAFSLVGGVLTKLSIESLEASNYPEARTYASQASNSFALSEAFVDALLPVSNIVGRGVTLRTFKEKLEIGQYIDQILIDVSYGLEDYALAQQTADNSSAKAVFIRAVNKLKQAMLTLKTIEAEGGIPQEYEEKLGRVTQAGEYFLSVSDVLPSVLGFDGKRTYLVLFQNNNELRPGGGFIGSYGIMHIEKGVLIDLIIHDVYDADGQLTAHVEPPFPLREYLGASHWYLRDSNFAVDFPENAARAAYFLKLETGEVVDGVIGVDTDFISTLLTATGPIEVADYNETITADNFSEKTQQHVEEDFFPGSQKKKQFLKAFYDQLSYRILEEKSLSLPLFLDSFITSLEEKHIMIALAHETDQTPLTIANLSGSLWDSRSEREGVFNDFLGIVEANLGENKVNPYIERYIKQDVSLTDEGDLLTTVTIVYQNTSSEASLFGGTYENYIRFVVPYQTNPTTLVIDGEEQVMLATVEDISARQARGRVSTNTIQVDIGEEKNKRTVGFVIEVPPQGKKEIQVSFQSKTSFSTKDAEFTYDLALFKQPGRGEDPYSFHFTYPNAFQPVFVSEPLKFQKDSLSAFFLLKKDTSLSFILGKK